ncbi:MAG: acyltransferase [Aestuariibacter sp.]|nr:acyltransferase [Aestuariibacter sp.]
MSSGKENLQLEQYQLGVNNGKFKLEGRQELQITTQNMAEQAHLSIDILTYDLDAPVYDSRLFLDVIKRLARKSHGLCLRVLLQNNEKVQKEGHRLLELTRRLTSKIEIRKPHPDFQALRETFMVVDAQGYVRRPNHLRHDGEADFKAPLKARELIQLYNEIWEASEPDSELRRLYL